ncbi:hypothetical protein PLICRDRAFT_455172 [Plicaturopsis crispa FD-325 SS-3]|uniref:Uncharacterized protein n=1 Tax=Plicaturopsis crispa FD-325 SS-3 TaxID=944288 RepID=A0A0C9T214_PLICR|nr:hypothetical protein PLICRDRAFT_455172 [Plicaturopsis crispa FD-325 SS-3]
MAPVACPPDILSLSSLQFNVSVRHRLSVSPLGQSAHPARVGILKPSTKTTSISILRCRVICIHYPTPYRTPKHLLHIFQMIAVKFALILLAVVATPSVAAHSAAASTTLTAEGPGPVCLPQGNECSLTVGARCCPGLVCVSHPRLLFRTCEHVL